MGEKCLYEELWKEKQKIYSTLVMGVWKTEKRGAARRGRCPLYFGKERGGACFAKVHANLEVQKGYVSKKAV